MVELQPRDILPVVLQLRDVKHWWLVSVLRKSPELLAPPAILELRQRHLAHAKSIESRPR